MDLDGFLRAYSHKTPQATPKPVQLRKRNHAKFIFTCRKMDVARFEPGKATGLVSLPNLTSTDKNLEMVEEVSNKC